ncbi:hypothetical protein WICPIJ_006697 [Wickerhamomyces pijperi]|uniref:Spore wall maturation protein DIT1 n=1 Tax=Wickerhamomyces pijperi TaxID=599730 RepID=A0A9P8TKR9_WICPI|nr:hypothetical protein WICPIJ_006697 [Wickerhamomyces pijperi]
MTAYKSEQEQAPYRASSAEKFQSNIQVRELSEVSLSELSLSSDDSSEDREAPYEYNDDMCDIIKQIAIMDAEYIPRNTMEGHRAALVAAQEAAVMNRIKATRESREKTTDNSTFSRVLCIYTRKGLSLIDCEEKKGFNAVSVLGKLTGHFETLDKQLESEDNFKQMVVNVQELYQPYKEPSCFEDVTSFWILEHHFKNSDYVKGLVLINTFTGVNTQPQYNNFHKWFAKLIVRDTKTNLSFMPANYDEDMSVATRVADYFNEHLKNNVQDDKWEVNGREYFIERAHFFTRRNLKLQAVLPAFPCKSSNLDKVGGTNPDKGEELGLRRLIAFTEEMERIYAPGFKVWIVSDGHVFSDCIGVDDDVVDDYTETLKGLYKKIIAGPEFKNKECIGFVSLKDVLYKSDMDHPIPKAAISDFQVNHLTGTKIDPDSDLSRQMLMAGCDTDDGQLAQDISVPNHPRLNLFRGFSRFMKEDLIKNDFFKGTSKKQFNKTISQVAFEMIKRNDAYSNLVELIFPFHLRFSIHAHNNFGPKFGIKLIKSDNCKIIKALGSSEEPECEDLLHIPTPWHNIIAKIEGSEMHYLTKTKAVKDAIKEGHYSGEWIENDYANGRGGYYLLKKTAN